MTMILDQPLTKVLRKLFLSLDTPVSRKCLSRIEAGDVAGLVSMTINPRDYDSPLMFRKDYQAVNFMRKCRLELPGISKKDRAQRAVDAFYASEASCARTNTLFRRAIENGPLSPLESRMLAQLERGRDWLTSVLGAPPGTLKCRFGPGSTYDDRAPLNTVPDKLSSRPTLTSGVTPLFDTLVRGSQLNPTAWFRCITRRSFRASAPLVVRGNRFTTVNKDAQKDRGIAVEPSVNVYGQLGAGRALRGRLRREAGIDLDHLAERHREWARQASSDGLHATIDLSNASDSVARQLIRWFLAKSPGWLSLLESLRSPTTLICGKTVYLQKFSSMGNGFTFELETLIFLAICKSVVRGESGREFSCFGDDIIVPTENALDVVCALKFCGFTPNPRKTFVDGWFRESCGGDYFKGVAVKGHYLEELPVEPHHWIALANGIRRMAHGRSESGFQFSVYRHAWFACLDNLPREIRQCRGPASLGDQVIHDHEFQRRWRGQIGYVRCWRPVSLKVPFSHWDSEVVMAYILYQIDQKGSNTLPTAPTTGITRPIGQGAPSHENGKLKITGHKYGWVACS